MTLRLKMAVDLSSKSAATLRCVAHDGRGKLLVAGAGLLMASAVALDREALATVATFEIFLAEMHSHVVLHVAFLGVRRAADGARQELLAALVPLRAHESLNVALRDALD